MKRPILALALCLAAGYMSPPSFADESNPCQTPQADTMACKRRLPVLASIESGIPNTPLESLRRLVAARNLEQHGILGDESIPLLDEPTVEGDAIGAETIVEVAIVEVAVVESPLPLETEIQPAIPTYRVTPRLVKIEQHFQHWLEPNVAEDFIVGDAAIVAGITNSAADSSAVEILSAAELDTPILPEFASVSTASIDPFLSGEFHCFDFERIQSPEQAARRLPTVDSTIAVPIVVQRETKPTQQTVVIFFDDDYEEEDMLLDERVAVEAVLQTVR
ncbi:MAG: hypothetical protein O3A00_01240 [Planctomycetota bacterium]|nr:hypothetical protein [Planctomycetota bacterium]